LDFVAKRYGVLPSVVLESGSSIDYKVAHLAVQYENWSREAAERKAKGLPPPPPKKSVQDLQSMLDQVRNRK